jgi:3-hydroxyisobutyrate dehydrogenase-like beta-hydroxyacid dehydrogenase
MGSRMAANLCRAGFDVVAWNRTAAKAEELARDHGADVVSTPADAAAGADAMITMVVDSPDVESVLFGPTGAASAMTPGALCVDMSTIAPEASRSIAGRLRRRGVGFLDAPVSGSRPRAEDGTLTIMAGGPAEDFERALPLLRAMGELVVHVGPQGHGSLAKLINNTAAAINAAGVAEALVLARRAGLDVDALLCVMSAGSGASAMLELKARPMLEREFEPLFKLGHMLKDLRHCLTAAASEGVHPSLAQAAAALYAEAEEASMADSDFAAVIAAVEQRTGPDPPSNRG